MTAHPSAPSSSCVLPYPVYPPSAMLSRYYPPPHAYFPPHMMVSSTHSSTSSFSSALDPSTKAYSFSVPLPPSPSPSHEASSRFLCASNASPSSPDLPDADLSVHSASTPSPTGVSSAHPSAAYLPPTAVPSSTRRVPSDPSTLSRSDSSLVAPPSLSTSSFHGQQTADCSFSAFHSHSEPKPAPLPRVVRHTHRHRHPRPSASLPSQSNYAIHPHPHPHPHPSSGGGRTQQFLGYDTPTQSSAPSTHFSPSSFQSIDEAMRSSSHSMSYPQGHQSPSFLSEERKSLGFRPYKQTSPLQQERVVHNLSPVLSATAPSTSGVHENDHFPRDKALSSTQGNDIHSTHTESDSLVSSRASTFQELHEPVIRPLPHSRSQSPVEVSKEGSWPRALADSSPASEKSFSSDVDDAEESFAVDSPSEDLSEPDQFHQQHAAINGTTLLQSDAHPAHRHRYAQDDNENNQGSMTSSSPLSSLDCTVDALASPAELPHRHIKGEPKQPTACQTKVLHPTNGLSTAATPYRSTLQPPQFVVSSQFQPASVFFPQHTPTSMFPPFYAHSHIYPHPYVYPSHFNHPYAPVPMMTHLSSSNMPPSSSSFQSSTNSSQSFGEQKHHDPSATSPSGSSASHATNSSDAVHASMILLAAASVSASGGEASSVHGSPSFVGASSFANDLHWSSAHLNHAAALQAEAAHKLTLQEVDASMSGRTASYPKPSKRIATQMKEFVKQYFAENQEKLMNKTLSSISSDLQQAYTLAHPNAERKVVFCRTFLQKCAREMNMLLTLNYGLVDKQAKHLSKIRKRLSKKDHPSTPSNPSLSSNSPDVDARPPCSPPVASTEGSGHLPVKEELV